MDCLSCGKPMELRELRPVYESGGILFRLECAARAYACDGCKTFSPSSPPAAAPPVETPPAETPATPQG